MTTTLTPPSGFTPRALTSWNRYFIPQADTNVYRAGDAVHSAGGTDANGIIAVTLHSGTGPARGVIVSVDPGLPATGGLMNGQKLSIPAVKTKDYYVWVVDDPSAQFAMVDDGLTPANSVAAAAGKYANFTPGASAAANGGSTAAIASSTLGATSGCLQVLSLVPGSAYGAAATWLVKFAAHELANGGATTVASGAIARSAAQLAGTPSGADVALGAAGQFYDPQQTVDATHPWVYYSASATAYVKIAGAGGTPATTVPNALGATAQVGSSGAFMRADAVLPLPSMQALNGINIPVGWDAAANNPVLASSTFPADGFNYHIVTNPGTTNLDGITTWNLNDEVYYGADGHMHRIAAPAGTALQKADGSGGLTSAVSNVDYMPAPIWQTGVPVGTLPSCTIGNNGAVTGATNLPRNYLQGAWLYVTANALYSGSAAGCYWFVSNGTAGAGTFYSNFISVSQFTLSSTDGYPAPTNPTAIVATGPGAYTSSTATIYLPGKKVPANSMGKNGTVQVRYGFRNNNSAGSKTVTGYFGSGGTILQMSTTAASTATGSGGVATVSNLNATNVQNSPGTQDTNQSAAAYGSVDTTADQYVAFKVVCGTAGDCVVIENMMVLVQPGA